MMIELAGGPRDGEWIDTQDHPAWVREFPAMKGNPLSEEDANLDGKYVRTDRMIEDRVVFEYKDADEEEGE